MKFTGHYNWQGEIHKLWTHAKDKPAGHRNFITQLSRRLGISNYRLRCHFNGYLDNYKIMETKE
ncbi:MAG: hypothetical protein KKD77_21950 [Gammaproteobacteria bacterium]|nr:hypothetical protein [Gammaproteobacteria bacterium]